MTDDEAKREAHEITDAVIKLQSLITGYPPRERVVEVARFLVGTGRVFEPTGANDGPPRHLFCFGQLDNLGRGLPWCAAFVCWCFRMSLVPLVEPVAAERPLWACSALYALALARGAILPIGAVPAPGDVNLMHSRGKSDPLTNPFGVHHVGIVEAVDGELVHSIEGNWRNRLERVTRRVDDSDFVAFARF